MTNQPYQLFSVITEITDIWRERPVEPFMRSWLAGSMAGGSPAFLFALPIAAATLLSAGDLSGLFLLTIPFLIAGAVTLPAMLVLGLPATILLHHFRHESVLCYAKLGLIFGFLIPLTVMLLLGGPLEVLPFVVIPGIMAGISSSFVWGRWRARVALEQEEPATPISPTNPIHDLIH